jgi:hypothetical protein
MHPVFYENLVNDHIRDLENEAAAWHARHARRTAKKSHGAIFLSRLRRRSRRERLAGAPAIHTFETTTPAT